jgi:hypothetical protein
MASLPLPHPQQHHGNPPLPLSSPPSWSRKRPSPKLSASDVLTRCAPARPVDLTLAGVDVAGDPLLGPSDYWAFGADMDESNAVGGGSIFPRRAPFFSNPTAGADRTLSEDPELATPPYTPLRSFTGGLASAAAGVVIIEAGRSRATTTSTSTTRTQHRQPSSTSKAHTKETPSSGIKYIGVSRAKTYALRDHTSLPRPLPLVRPIASHPLASPAPPGG